MGYRYYDRTGTVRSILIRNGKLKINARGADLNFALTENPDPVYISLILGDYQQCMYFGGTVEYVPNVSYKAEHAPAPQACTFGPSQNYKNFLKQSILSDGFRLYYVRLSGWRFKSWRWRFLR